MALSSFSLRRFANAIMGTGPWRIAPFETVAHERTNYSAGVHRAEDFTGILHMEEGESADYPSGTALLNQNPNWEFLRGDPRYRSTGIVPRHERIVYSMSNAGVAGTDGVVYCPQTRRAIAETVHRWTTSAINHPLFGAVRFPAARKLPGLSLSLLTLSGEGFYHQLVKCIPSLHLLRPWLNHADHILCAGQPDNFHARWFDHAGVPMDKVVWMNDLSHYKCDQLLFTSSLMRDQQPIAWTVEAIRNSFPDPSKSSSAPSMVWISRKDAKVRNATWEQDLLHLLPDFMVVELASMPPAEQIALVANAKVIAGPHGAGLSNVTFCRPGTKVIELLPAMEHYTPAFSRLSAVVGLPYGWAEIDFKKAENLPALAAAIRNFVSKIT